MVCAQYIMPDFCQERSNEEAFKRKILCCLEIIINKIFKLSLVYVEEDAKPAPKT